MTLNDMINNGLSIEGNVRIQSWGWRADEPTIHYVGNCISDCKKEFLEKYVLYMFSRVSGKNENGAYEPELIIEIEADEE